MRLFARRLEPEHLPEVWRARVPGTAALSVVADTSTGSVFVSDGWGVSYPALAVHRLDLRTGERLASARTGHQPVGAMRVDGDDLWVATSRRVLRLTVAGLEPLSRWDEGLVSDADQLIAHGPHLVLANPLRPMIGVVDAGTGVVRRLRAGAQPVLARTDDGVHVASAVVGMRWRLDPGRGRLVVAPPGPAVTALASDGTVLWGVAAGRTRTDRQGARPIVTRDAGRELVAWEAPERRIRLDDSCEALVEGSPGVLWAITGQDRRGLCRVDTRSGTMGTQLRAHGQGRFLHVSALAGLAFALTTCSDDPAESWVHALRLPTGEPTRGS